MAHKNFAVIRGAGRPPLYETEEQLAAAIEEYFSWAAGEYKEIEKVEGVGESKRKVLDEFGEPIMVRKWIRQPEIITITGLALYLGFTSRQGFRDSAKRGEKFSAVLTRGQMLVEMDYEQRLAIREKNQGAQFALMNMGWAANTKYSQLGKDGEPVDPPQQIMIINGQKIKF